MNMNTPVKIPEIPGKIRLVPKGDAVYVRYLLGRTYDKERKYTVPEYRVIGVQIERMPTLMLPNDNYELFFTSDGEPRAGTQDIQTEDSGIQRENEETDRTEELTGEEQHYMDKRSIYLRYKPFFTDLFYEIRAQSRKKQTDQITPYVAETMNRILKPLRELMTEEDYADLLQDVEISKEAETGMTYGELMILLIEYKCALYQFREKEHF